MLMSSRSDSNAALSRVPGHPCVSLHAFVCSMLVVRLRACAVLKPYLVWLRVLHVPTTFCQPLSESSRSTPAVRDAATVAVTIVLVLSSASCHSPSLLRNNCWGVGGCHCPKPTRCNNRRLGHRLPPIRCMSAIDPRPFPWVASRGFWTMLFTVRGKRTSIATTNANTNADSTIDTPHP